MMPVTFIEGTHWEKCTILGKGSFGEVWLAIKKYRYSIQQWEVIENFMFCVKTVRLAIIIVSITIIVCVCR